MYAVKAHYFPGKFWFGAVVIIIENYRNLTKTCKKKIQKTNFIPSLILDPNPTRDL